MNKFFSIMLLITFFYSCTTSDDVKIRCVYMAYSCGDCYPQFKVDSIYTDPNNILENGEDLYLKYFNGENLIEFIDSCWICYDYYIIGNVKKSIFSKYKTIEVTEYNLILNKEEYNW